jgi:MYXO-CTERM domain-containing protein
MRPTLAALFVALGVLAHTAPAHAYVRLMAISGVPMQWTTPCIPIVVFTDDLTDMTPDQIMNASAAAAATWSAGANTCTPLSLEVTRASGPAPIPLLDHVNTITFRHDAWCSQVTAGNPCTPDDPAQPALTTVFTAQGTGQIVEADIEINAHDFTWADLQLMPGATGSEDLQNVLTHEIGHLLGLETSCWIPMAGASAPLDDQGQPAPACDQAPPDVQETTMFELGPPGETKKRTLAADDQRALCAIYPAGAFASDGGADAASCLAATDASADASVDTGTDALVDAGADATSASGRGGGCSCAMSHDRPGAWAGLGFLTLLLVALVRRRTRPTSWPGA